jgi:hypothetical protein
MRITIPTTGSRGDVEPYIALGVGLRARGHEVCVATHANFEKAVCQHGLEFYLSHFCVSFHACADLLWEAFCATAGTPAGAAMSSWRRLPSFCLPCPLPSAKNFR